MGRSHLGSTDLDARNEGPGDGINGPLHWAAFDGKLEHIVELIDSLHVDVSDRDGYGYTALHNACFNGHLTIVRALLERGAEVTSVSNELAVVKEIGSHALMLPAETALKRGHHDLVTFLDANLANLWEC